jgi:hypothetical protein
MEGNEIGAESRQSEGGVPMGRAIPVPLSDSGHEAGLTARKSHVEGRDKLESKTIASKHCFRNSLILGNIYFRIFYSESLLLNEGSHHWRMTPSLILRRRMPSNERMAQVQNEGVSVSNSKNQSKQMRVKLLLRNSFSLL